MQWRQVLLPASIAGTVLAFTERKAEERKVPLPSYTQRVQKAATVIQRFMVRNGVPGLSVGVTLNGRRAWNAGFGLADVEQMVPCTGRTVMRIASISKAITAVIAARLVQEGKLDLDAPIQTYVQDFPKKYFDGEAVDITSRQLLCHTSGIRHYKEGDRQGIEPNESADGVQGETPEFLSNKHYNSVSDALEMFKDSDLISKPGAKFNYTTHGFTLLSAVLEKAADSSFAKQASRLFKELGMNHTFLDDNRSIVANRSRYYYRDRNHKLKNAPEVDNSYKWAGGGLLSNVDDLLVFADAMLYWFDFLNVFTLRVMPLDPTAENAYCLLKC